jgi:hypothetical protein
VGGQLQRLVLDFCAGELVVRTLYRTRASPRPGELTEGASWVLSFLSAIANVCS